MGLISSLTGLVLAHIMLALPYVIIALLAGLRNFDMSQEMVARSLGMNRFRAFMAVTLPQIKPSVKIATFHGAHAAANAKKFSALLRKERAK